MIHIDIEKLEEARPHRRGRTSHHRQSHRAKRAARRKQGGKGGEYLDLAVDDHSRLAYSEILPDETRRSCLKFLFNALRFYRDHGVRILRVMTDNTDNGVSFRSLSSHKGVANCVVDLRPASHNLSEMREALFSIVSTGIFDHTIAASWQYIIYVEIVLKIQEMDLPRSRNNFAIQERIRACLKRLLHAGWLHDSRHHLQLVW